MKYQIIDNYYFDIDDNNQFRIAGPGNHLFLGFKVINDTTIDFTNYSMSEDNQLIVELTFDSNEVEISTPLVCDIRTLRSHTEGKKIKPSYAELVKANNDELSAHTTKDTKDDQGRNLSFLRTFLNEADEEKTYGASIHINESVDVSVKETTIHFSSNNPVVLRVKTIGNIHLENSLSTPVFSERHTPPNFYQLREPLQRLYDDSGAHIAHLVKARKTSSFEYGTIFPRDWIESAQLGQGDLSQDAIDFMIYQSLKHVDELGQGWHEELIGEYRYKSSKELAIDRKMIDIEPLYLLSLKLVSKQFLLQSDNLNKIRVVGRYVLSQARSHELITFKMKDQTDEYQEVGNWRDSTAAFPENNKPLAPYDVNCVFYPLALQVIYEYRDLFELTAEEMNELQSLMTFWNRQKKKYLVIFAKNLRGYCLALHGNPPMPLSVAHLDESYDLFFGEPSLEDTMSFADRILSDEYFYTPVGPMLVASTTTSLSEKNYHGKVIWPKQAAFAVAGLAREYRYGVMSGWPRTVLSHLYEAIVTTSESCFKGWEDLGSVTELYYYDPAKKKARFYLDQEEVEGQMSVVQLWSAVGCRRIVHDYLSIKELAKSRQ